MALDKSLSTKLISLDSDLPVDSAIHRLNNLDLMFY